MAGLIRNRYKREPEVGGANAYDQSTVYDKFYGSMPIPATQYVLADTPLRSVDVQPSVRTVMSNASVVDRANDRQGMIATAGRQLYQTPTPQVYDSPDSSKFQDQLVGPMVNYYKNTKWYIDYPAATVMLGGQHNLALSQRIPQLPTRTTGGPGPGSMRQAPRFKSVQTVPRYSTMPTTYRTSSAKG